MAQGPAQKSGLSETLLPMPGHGPALVPMKCSSPVTSSPVFKEDQCQRRTCCCPPTGDSGLEVSFQMATRLQSTLCPTLSTSFPVMQWPAHGHPCEPIFCQTLRPLSLKAIHGLGLPHSWVQVQLHGDTREGSPGAQHSQTQVALPCAQAPQPHQAWA